jgi:hypothetical protein
MPVRVAATKSAISFMSASSGNDSTICRMERRSGSAPSLRRRRGRLQVGHEGGGLLARHLRGR